MLPNFIIGGASKTGSTWLSRCLDEHPEIFVPLVRPDFFSLHYDRGQGWYESLFKDAEGSKAIGERSGTYLTCPEAPGRIKACLPKVLLMFFLRDPIGRAISHYRMELRGGSVSANIDEVLVPGHPLVEEGRYFHHIQRYLEHFPKDQVRVYIYDELKNDPKNYLRGIYRTLGVDPDFTPTLAEKKYHVTKARPRFQHLYKAGVSVIRWAYRLGPTSAGMVERLRQKGAFDAFHRLNRGPSFPEMSPAHARLLAEYYRPDITALGNWLGQDLSHWLEPHAASTPPSS